jgi:saccharopine dehydrogenase-like NADP-dependent oxidoreductase
MEELDPVPFMEKLNKHGLPWVELFPGSQAEFLS